MSSIERTLHVLRETDIVPNPEPSIVTADEFTAVDEPGAAALVGDLENALIAENSAVMFYGDGGAGKTTLTLDLACHLAAGDDWLMMAIPRALRVLVIENEGPRALFRTKVRRKVEAWAGSPLEDRLIFWEAPWAKFTFADAEQRLLLAEVIRAHKVDVVLIGPITASGMETAGTLQDVRAFLDLLEDVRGLCGRHVTFALVHHENKGGTVSGAWEGCGDTLLHVQGQSNGRTRLFIQKARWASEYHETTLHLVWADGDGFAVEDKPELDDDAIADAILEHVRTDPGTAWGKVEKEIKGVGNDRVRAVRDGLFTAGEIVNLAKVDGVDVLLQEVQVRRTPRLFVADDPTIAHLRPKPDADGAQTVPAGGAGSRTASAPCAPPLGGAGVGAVQMHPLDDADEDIPFVGKPDADGAQNGRVPLELVPSPGDPDGDIPF